MGNLPCRWGQRPERGAKTECGGRGHPRLAKGGDRKTSCDGMGP